MGLIFVLVISIVQGFSAGQLLYSLVVMLMCQAGMAGLLLAFGALGANFNWDDPRKMNAGSMGCLGQIATVLFLPVAFGAFILPLALASFFGFSIAYGYLAGLLLGAGVTLFSAYMPLWLVRRKVERLGEESDNWVGGWGVNLTGGTAQGTTTTSRKLHDLIRATGEYSLEAWVVPGNVTQENRSIVGYSGGTTVRNFTLGQTLYSYDFLARSTTTGPNGDPRLSTAAADEDLQATLQHVVATFDPVNGRRIYVNGEFTGDLDTGGGTLADWDDTFAFVLGNEVGGTMGWTGQIRFVAVHNRALTPNQVRQNFDAGTRA